MKNPFIIACLIAFFSNELSAQSITTKEVRSAGFSQAKFKKAPKRVYINSFNVFFQVIGTASASTMGGEHFGRAHSGTNTFMGVQLDGVDADDFLQITNAAYNMFVNDLTSKGFEIVSADEAGQTSVYSDWLRKDGGELSSAEAPGWLRVTPAGYTYFVRGEKRSGKEKETVFDRSPQLSKDLNDATVVDINFTIDFIEMKTFSSELLNVSNVKGKIAYKVARSAGASQRITQCNFNFGKTFTAQTGQVINELKKNLPLSAKVFQDEKFSETTVGTGMNVPQYHKVLFLGSDVTSVSHYAKADRDVYVAEADRLIIEFLNVSLENFYKHALK